MDIIIIDGYRARIECDGETHVFRDEIEGLNGGADFFARNRDDLRVEFKRSLETLLELCKEQGINPHRQNPQLSSPR